MEDKQHNIKAALRALHEAIKAEDSLEGEFGPIQRPIQKFLHLPEHTRKWLEELREEDIEEIDDAVGFYRKSKSFLTVFKWLVVTLVAVFMGTYKLGEAILKITTGGKGTP